MSKKISGYRVFVTIGLILIGILVLYYLYFFIFLVIFAVGASNSEAQVSTSFSTYVTEFNSNGTVTLQNDRVKKIRADIDAPVEILDENETTLCSAETTLNRKITERRITIENCALEKGKQYIVKTKGYEVKKIAE